MCERYDRPVAPGSVIPVILALKNDRDSRSWWAKKGRLKEGREGTDHIICELCPRYLSNIKVNIRHDEAPGGLDRGNSFNKKSKRRRAWNGNGATVISKEGGPRSRSGEKVGRDTK